MKHTKGPWKAVFNTDNSPIEILNSRCENILSVLYDAYSGGEDTTTETDRANARLMASAPELFKTLEDLNCLLTELNAAGKLPNNKKLNTLIKESFDLITRTTGENNDD